MCVCLCRVVWVGVCECGRVNVCECVRVWACVCCECGRVCAVSVGVCVYVGLCV